jgi:Ca-activated chloride channel family protein
VAIDRTALALVLGLICLLVLFWQRARRYPQPALRYSILRTLKPLNRSLKARLAILPDFLAYGALLLFLLAFIDPHLYRPRSEASRSLAEKGEGIAIYLVLDQSESMEIPVTVTHPDGTKEEVSKIDLLKRVSKDFVRGRPQDLIGLVAFARGAQVLSPLTLDHRAILNLLDRLDIMRLKDQSGTAIGYATFKTANLIAATRQYAQEGVDQSKPPYEIKSAVMILVTDGFQAASPLDTGKRLRTLTIPEAADYANSQGIKLYIINLEPKFAEEEFVPQRNQMQRAAERTGGRFYLVNRSNSLADIYAQIDQLEKGHIEPPEGLQPPPDQLPHLYQRVSLFPYLIGVGMLLLLSAVVLESTVLRRVP